MYVCFIVNIRKIDCKFCNIKKNNIIKCIYDFDVYKYFVEKFFKV